MSFPNYISSISAYISSCLSASLFALISFLICANSVQAQVIYSENFSGGSASFTESGGMGLGWQIGTDAGQSINGTDMAFVDDDANGNTTPGFVSIFTSPEFDLESYGQVNIQFDYNFRSSCGVEEFRVEILDSLGVWSTLLTINSDDCGPWGCDAALGAYPSADIIIPQLHDDFKFRFTYDDPIACWGWYVGIDNIILLEIPPVDLATEAVLSPIDGCGFTDSETVIIEINNPGSVARSGFGLNYSVNGLTGITEIYADTIEPGVSTQYQFINPANLSSGISFEIKAWISDTLDSFGTNDTVLVLINESPEIIAPQFYDFDAGIMPSGWSNDPFDIISGSDWIFLSGPTLFVSGTGPDADHTSGSGFYLYLSDFSEQQRINLLSPCMDVSSLITPYLSFWYHSHEVNDGADSSEVNSLHIDVLSGGTWYEDVTSIIKSEVNKWQFREIDLSSFGPGVQVRFRGNTENETFSHFIAIDDVRFFDKPENDIGIAAIVNPASGCGLDSSMAISVEIENFGSDTQYNFSLSLIFEEADTLTELFTDTILSGATIIYEFDSLFDLSAFGNYKIKSWTSLTTDSSNINDTLCFELLSVPLIDSFPYLEDFESDTIGWFAFGGSWELGNPNGTIINSPPLASPSSLYSWITNADGYYNDDESGYVFSPCFDFTSLIYPEVSFDIWWDTDPGFDGANLEYSTDNGTNWNPVGEVSSSSAVNWYNEIFVEALFATSISEGWSNDAITSGSQKWVSSREDLPFLAGESSVRFRVNFYSGANFSDFDGFAFDNFRIRDKALNDLSVNSINDPVTDCGLTDFETIAITLENLGVNAQSNFEIWYQVNSLPPISVIYTDTIPGLSTFSWAFTVLADFSIPGNYSIKAWTALDSDQSVFNDTALTEIVSIPLINSYPYIADFENGNQFWHSEGQNSTWEIASPAGFVINSAVDTGLNCWITNADGLYAANERSYVVSPCFDFTSLIKPAISFDIWWETQSFAFTGPIDGAVLQASTDEGLSWFEVGEAFDPWNWYNHDSIAASPGDQLPPANGWAGVADLGDGSGGWLSAFHSLSDLATLPSVRLRFAFASDNSIQFDGIAFDNVIIGEIPVVDLGADTAFCIDDSLDLVAGLLAELYVWSTADTTQIISVDTAGFYSVIIIDSLHFVGQDTIKISLLALPEIELGIDRTLCEGDSLFAGGTGYSYFWSNGAVTSGISIDLPGIYSVVLTDSITGCVNTDSVDIDLINNPVADFGFAIVDQEVSFFNTSINGDVSFWSFGDLNTSTQANPTHSYSESGTYSVTLTISNDCGSSEITIQVSVIVSGIEGIENKIPLLLHPNPASMRFFIDWDQSVKFEELQIMDLRGQILLTYSNPVPGEFSVEGIASGTYLIRCFGGGNFASQKLIIINK